MKLTTKLLLGATLVAGLSMSAFAACANNVLMGDKQLKDVADGTADGDAVNYGQLMKKVVTSVPMKDGNVSVYGPNPLKLEKKASLYCISGVVRNDSGAAMSAGQYSISNSVGVSASAFTALSTYNQFATGSIDAMVHSNGLIYIQVHNTWNANALLGINGCWSK